MLLDNLDIDQLKFDDIDVEVEFKIENNRRLDFLLTDIENKLLIIIGHKYGGMEAGSRLLELLTKHSRGL